MLTLRRPLFLAASALALAPAGFTLSAQAKPAPRAPQLVVMITVDQLRADAYERYRKHITGGLARIYEQGAVFTEGYQDHAFTETAPGHASLLSGRFPVHTGIATNAHGVNTPNSPLLMGRPGEPGASPFRVIGTGLLDWMRAVRPDTRFLSVSRKDRGAILPIGRAKGDVYWYSTTGRFTTSTYYADTLPSWVRQFNDRQLARAWAGKSWELLRDAAAYAEPDSVPVENQGRDYVFPHQLPRDSTALDTAIVTTPFMDQMTLQLALEGVERVGLGATVGRTDLLAVSLSSTDAVGHRYGPDSREYHDQVLRLDQYLGAFLDSLFTMRDSTRIVIALSADHGVMPFPTLVSTVEPNAGATRVDMAPTWAMTRARLARAGVPDSLVTMDQNILVLQTKALAARGFSADSIALAFARDVKRINGVLRADLVSALARVDTTKDVIARRWLHTLNPASDTTRLAITFTVHSYYGQGTNATHGSPHDGDAHVPIVFRGPGVKKGRVRRFVRTVDIGPTLAALIGVAPMEKLDGRVLREAMK